MFVSRVFYAELVEARTEVRVLSETNKVLQAHLDNARLRLNQLEKERAQMLYALSGTKIETPEFSRQNGAYAGSMTSLTDLPGIEDIGDELAAHLGIGWDKDGRVSYADPNARLDYKDSN